MWALLATGLWRCSVFSPVRIYPNVEICQIYYHTLEGDFETYKSGKYQNNTGIQPSRLYFDFKGMDSIES